MSAPTTNSTITYSERLWPTFGYWFITAALSAMTSLMVIPVWAAGGIIVPIVVFVLAALVLRALSARIVVTADTFYADKAHIDRAFIRSAEAFEAEEAFAERGMRLDARAFLMTRPWVKDVVKVTIDDADDVTPYWIVSTRNATALAAALQPEG
ncbi:DUF3093 domain-containing protein [Brevibacterium samyangense]|uniref:DUF3093 domain-containing protein n=1 Tax=Brevibacterium samyangense TaxID=366888 RepID=A0ABN2TDS7_9MICO